MRVCFARCNCRLLFSGQTALHRYSRKGHLEVCKLLVECQADVNAKDTGSYAIRSKIETAELLASYSPPALGTVWAADAAGRVLTQDEVNAIVEANPKRCDARPLHMLLKTKAGLWFCFERYVTLLFFSVNPLHCITLLKPVTWKFASSWSRKMLT
jgi:hypothetical protein